MRLLNGVIDDDCIVVMLHGLGKCRNRLSAVVHLNLEVFEYSGEDTNGIPVITEE
jgi:hypothetical protein